MTRIGLRGAPCGEIDQWGIARLDAQREPMAWWVAASDRWHDPRQSPSVRQQRVDGTPVVETKLAVPGGDVLLRAFVVADQGGALVYQFTNRSRAAVVIAVPTREMSTTASSPGTAPQGIDLPLGVRAFPLTHESSVVFAWPITKPRWRRRRGLDASALASADAVARGWVQASEAASRVSVASRELTGARSDILLADAREVDQLLRRDPALGVLAVWERARMGDTIAPWIDVVADAVQRVARHPETSPWSWRALSAAGGLFDMADEADAASDAVALWQRCLDTGSSSAARPENSAVEHVHDTDGWRRLSEVVTHVSGIEDRLARPVSPLETQLFSDALVGSRGTNFEAHSLPAGPRHRLSLALRWHGGNAALLWELDGPPGLQLTAPALDARFRTVDAQGEALLQVTP